MKAFGHPTADGDHQTATQRFEMMYGTVKTYFEDRSFGFIAQDDGGADVFFHLNNVVNADVLSRGTKVSFQVEASKSGKAQAGNVHVIQ